MLIINCFFIILQSTAGLSLLQFLAISLDLGLLSYSSRQPSFANRYSTWTEGVLHYIYLDLVFTPELVYLSGCRFSSVQLIWSANGHFSMLKRCAMSLTLVICILCVLYIISLPLESMYQKNRIKILWVVLKI
jgi:hypothetical protein